MTRLSDTTKKFLQDDIVSILYEKYPHSLFTNEIAIELRRDKEFIKTLLIKLKKKGLIEQTKKNKKGIEYKKRMRWKLPASIVRAFEKV